MKQTSAFAKLAFLALAAFVLASCPNLIIPPQEEIPAASSSLSAPLVNAGNGKLTISWEKKSGVITWAVYYNTSGTVPADPSPPDNANEVVSAPASSIEINGLVNGTTYHVWLRASDGSSWTGLSTRAQGCPRTNNIGFDSDDYVPVTGTTITGSDAYAHTVIIPAGYNGAGTSYFKKGVFTQGRTVTIGSFYMAKYETTRQLWYDVQLWAVSNDYSFQKNPVTSPPSEADKNKPVTGISWRDAVVWCNAFSEKGSKEPVYYNGANVIRDSRDAAACDGAVMDKTKSGYRLPTEAEMEFAARGADPANAAWLFRYAGGNTADAVAWYHGNSPYALKPAGGKTANLLGIHDLSGNAQEWCWDWMNYSVDVDTTVLSEDGAERNQMIGGRNGGNQKAFNGGGVGSNITMSCVTYRWGFGPDYNDSFVGFRVVYAP